uniref:EamA domain-containing protein n=1 Tax=Coccolithus braarudii TaxID=221442 RepID=A0A7S0LHD8_9EUKA
MGLRWLVALFGSSLTFALADILCDICIAESEEDALQTHSALDDDDGDADGASVDSDGGSLGCAADGDAAELQSIAGTSCVGYATSVVEPSSLSPASSVWEGVLSGSLPRYKQLSSGTATCSVNARGKAPPRSPPAPSQPITSTKWADSSETVALKRRPGSDPVVDSGLSGEQDTAIAGIVTIIGLLITVAYWLISGAAEARAAMGALDSNGLGALRGLPQLRWGPFTHLQFWLAMLGGAMAFLHYYFLLKAFEGAPSTVLLPLVQVASVSVLLGSSVLAILRNEPWITPVHALAYVLMLIGGILPACGGQLSSILRRAFWRQAFVYCAICAEFALGLHDLMLSGCSFHANRIEPSPGGTEEVVESFEFFVWSRCSFIATFVGMYTFSPKLNAQLRELFSGRIPTRYILLSAISEGLTVLGFYLASIAYGLFYQAGIVHAAEASLSQLLNLLLAFVLLKGFGWGRQSAVGSMWAKIVSFVMVSIGLFLCSLEDGEPSMHSSTPVRTFAASPPLSALPFAAHP